MSEDDFGFWLLMLTVAVIGGGAAALRWLRIARLIEDTPTSRVRSAAQGYVELAGRGLPLDGTQNPAPLTQRPCVWWRYRISKKTERGSGRGRRESWRTVASGTSSLPFLLDDDTGQCIVQPNGAEVVTGESTTWYGDTPWPAAIPTKGLLQFGERSYRYFEERIYEHERLYVLGGFRSSNAAAEDGQQGAATALLVQWKQDQPALLARFDADADGRISLDEWEQAREAARDTVREQRAGLPAGPRLHVLGQPGGDQLFLIAALPPGNLVRHYRRRAALAFGGFILAVVALGWLLQDVIG